MAPKHRNRQTSAHKTAKRSEAPRRTSVKSFHWTDDPVAAARHDLQVVAPGLSSLMYCPSLPEPILQDILDWTALFESNDIEAAFSLAWLKKILPALTVSFFASFRYEVREPHPDGGLNLHLHDLGPGALVIQVSGLLALIAKDSGRRGEQLLKKATNDFDQRLDRIKQMLGSA